MLTNMYLDSQKYPMHLNPQEIDDPYQVFADLFDFAKLPDLREILWSWLKATINKSFDSYPEFERSLILSLYEKLLKVIEAGYIIDNESKDLEISKSIIEETEE